MHVVLPFGVDDFIDVSVRPAGDQWIKRFNACMAQAKSISFLTEQSYLGDDILFGLGAKLAMGCAVLHARHIAGEAVQLAVWDQKVTSGPAGTGADVATWAAFNKANRIVDVADLGHVQEADSQSVSTALCRGDNGRVEAAMLFGDVQGFSKLGDAELLLFVDHVLGAIAERINSGEDQPGFINTWGDGLFAVWEKPSQAAERALLLQDTIADLQNRVESLPADLSMRMSLHYGVAHKVVDPILKRENFFGEAVSRAARIEPITPPGAIYTTEPFAAMLTLDKESRVVAEYIGNFAIAKGYGKFPLYSLRWKFSR